MLRKVGFNGGWSGRKGIWRLLEIFFLGFLVYLVLGKVVVDGLNSGWIWIEGVWVLWLLFVFVLNNGCIWIFCVCVGLVLDGLVFDDWVWVVILVFVWGV